MSFWNSLAGRLFKYVFAWYLGLAIVVTAVQLALEYSSINRDIDSDLESLGRSFAPSTADALWVYDSEQLDTIAKGIAQAAAITGVRIANLHDKTITHAGDIPDADIPAEAGLLAPYQHKRFPLFVTTPRGERKAIGFLHFFSARSVALERIKYSFMVILINSLIKTAGLWLIFYLVITRTLARRLEALTAVVSRAEFAAGGSAPVALDYPYQDELGRLLTAMRAMQGRVAAARREVEEINRHLEETVNARTQALRENEALLVQAQKLALMGHYVFDIVEDTWISSAGLDEIFGIGASYPRTLEGWLALVHPDDQARMADYIRQNVVAAGNSFDSEYRVVRPCDGELRWVHGLGQLESAPDGRPLRMFGVIQDITAYKRAEEDLRQMNETLDQLVQQEVAKNLDKERLLIQQSRLAAMGEMIGNIAHQWRQPLNALGLLFANLKDAYRYNELDEQGIDETVHTGNALIRKMSTTIDDFRDFFKPNKAKEWFRVEQAIQDVQVLLDHSLKGHGIEVRVEGDTGRELFGFPNEFSQVLLNVIGNAKDAFIAGRTGTGLIRVTLGHDAENLWVKIADNAGGIPEEIIPRLFDPYFTTKEKGTGIGLYMSRIIVEEHMNGRIDVRNTDGGAEFTIVLPRKE